MEPIPIIVIEYCSTVLVCAGYASQKESEHIHNIRITKFEMLEFCIRKRWLL